MRRVLTTLLLFAVLVPAFPARLAASSILLLSSGNASNDAAIVSALRSEGDSVTIGPTYNNFTGTGLSGYNAVFLNPNTYDPTLPNMPESGQQALIQYVNQGGGLVVGAMVPYLQPSINQPGGAGPVGQPTHDFSTLSAILPASPYNDVATSNSPITFTAQTSNAALNAGLSPSFSFQAGGYNTEALLTPKSGATSFFATNQWSPTFGGYVPGSGTIGWDYGSGRVLSLSTFSDNTALGDPNYDRLLGNSFNWATGTTSTPITPSNPPSSSPPSGETTAPEPSTLAVFALAGLGVWAASRSRRRGADSARE